MSSTTNIPINTRSMNGIITISDGVATMENGSLTNVSTLSASTVNSNNFNSNVLTATGTTINSVPLVVNSTYTTPNPYIAFSPYTSAGYVNPIIQAGDSMIWSRFSNGICFGMQTFSNSGFRADSNNTQQYGKFSLSYYVWNSSLADKKVLEMLASTITAYLPLYAPTPTSNTDNNRVITSAYGNIYFPQLMAPNVFSSTNTFTAQTTCTTAVVDDIPLYITYDDGTIVQDIRFYTNTNPTTGNPYTLAGDCCIVGSSDTVIGKYDRFNAIRFTDNDITAYANTQLNMIVNNLSVFTLTDTSLNISGQFFSGFTDPVLYENQFAGSIWGEKDVTCKMGLFIQDQITPGAITYASIDNNGNAELNSLTISSQGTTIYATIDASGNITAPTANITTITTTTQANADNSTKCATTAFVKNQGYAILNSANSFTGQQTLTYANNTFPLRVKSSTAVTTRELCSFVSTGAGSYNSIVAANDSILLGRDSAALNIGVLCLTTHSSTACGIRITNNSVLMTGTTIQTTGTLSTKNGIQCNNFVPTDSSFIGYSNQIETASWSALPGAAQAQLFSFSFDNATNYKYGTYRIEFMIQYTSTVNTQAGNFNFDTTSATTNSLRMVAMNSNAILIGTTYYYNFSLSFVDKIYANKTWYFNGASNIATLDTNSYIQVTRIG